MSGIDMSLINRITQRIHQYYLLLRLKTIQSKAPLVYISTPNVPAWDAEYPIEHTRYNGKITVQWIQILKAKFRDERSN